MEVLSKLNLGPYVAGEWIAGSGEFIVDNPATGEVLAHVGRADVSTIASALDSAASVQYEWAATAPRLRAELLRRCFELIAERADDFATLMTLEMGKPQSEARGEVVYGAEFFRWFSEEAARIHGRFGPAPMGNALIVTEQRPVGPVLAITPWNFPLAMGARKVAPALAAGCTVVLKPARQTPLTTLALMQVLVDAGIPAGVVNCVTTDRASEVSETLIPDPQLRKLTFTGSTQVGRDLLSLAAGGVLRTSMELGGNAPFVVLESANIDQAVEAAMVAKFRNNGEACTAANRFLVHENVVDEFASKFAYSASQLVLGDGMAPETTLGPLIDERAVAHVEELITDAVARGGEVLCGGERRPSAGYFMPATVAVGVPTSARVHREEVFGPFAAITAVSSTAEAVALANDTEFGLMSYVMAGDDMEALRAAQHIESGMAGINTGLVSNPAAPFGGVKHSGLGREGSREGLDEYLETVYYGMPR